MAVSTSNFPMALMRGKKVPKVEPVKYPKKGTSVPQLGMLFAKKGKRGT
jgi:hypothetical protein